MGLRLVAALVLALASTPGAGADAHPGGLAGVPSRPPVAPALHDLHVSYGSSVVEGNVVVVRIRFFEDDLTAALAGFAVLPDLVLTRSVEIDGLFLRYFRERFAIEVGGTALPPRIVASGEDELDREPVWWYAVEFEAETQLTVFRVRNTLLLELFDDQTNIVKFVRFPDQTQRTYAFQAGEEVFEVRF